MKFTTTSLALILAAASTSAFAQLTQTQGETRQGVRADAEPQHTTDPSRPKVAPSSRATKAILDLQTAVNAKDVANIPAKLAAAKAVASTNNDRYLIGELQLKAAADAHDLASASQAANDVAASGVLTTPDLEKLYLALGGSFYGAKQYDQAAADFEKASTLAPTDPNNALLIAQVRVAQGRKAEAAAAMQRAIQISKTAGVKPTEDVYRNAVSLAYDAKLPTSVSLAREWLAAYPSDDAWRNSLAIYRNVNGGDPDNVIDVMRLASLTNAIQTGNEYEVYAARAIEQSNFGEAKAAIDAGIAAGKLKAGDSDVAQMIVATKGKVPTAAELAAAEKGAVVPNAFLRVGDRYYAAGDYAKAATLYREALSKGADSSLANLRLGEALARSGDKAGAAAAFNAVSGSRSDLAKFWLLYSQNHA